MLAQDFGPISRTNDAQVALVKLDWRINETHNASLKYNYTNSRQENGTFDVDTWGRSSNAIEKDFSNAVNGSLVSHLTNTIDNEFRFQFAREDRPRPYSGPLIPGQSRPFSDTGMDFANGFRFGEPFFIPVKSYDTRVQALDNVSWVRGNHIFKTGFEYNRTAEHQTFIGFANGRFIFNSVTGFQNYVTQGNNYKECSTGRRFRHRDGWRVPSRHRHIGTGAPLPPAGRRWRAHGGASRNAGDPANRYGGVHSGQLESYAQRHGELRPAGGKDRRSPIRSRPPSQVFFSNFIGKTQSGYLFPSDGTIPSDLKMFQPRLGIAWDRNGDGTDVVRAAAGLYYARIPGLNLASARSTNGSIGQTIFRSSNARLPR